VIDLTLLRLLTDERIPAGGTEADTSFTDAELTSITSKCGDDVNLAASEVWRVKAGLVKSQMGDIENYSLGEESVKYTTLQQRYDHALALSEEYRKKSTARPATVFSQTPPDVLHSEDDND